MSTTREDQQLAARAATLLLLALLAAPALAVSAAWFTNLGQPKLWQLFAGPIPLAALLVLMARVRRAILTGVPRAAGRVGRTPHG